MNDFTRFNVHGVYVLILEHATKLHSGKDYYGPLTPKKPKTSPIHEIWSLKI